MKIQGDELEALVRGSQNYHVVVERVAARDGWVVGTTCSCPAGEDSNGHCKHVWAVLSASVDLVRKSWGAVPGNVADASELAQEIESDDRGGVIEVREMMQVIRETLGAGKNGAKTVEVVGVKPEALKHSLPRRMQSGGEGDGGPIAPVRWVVDVARSASNGCVVLQAVEAEGSKAVGLTMGHVGRLVDGRDRVIAAMLIGAGRSTGDGYFGSWQYRADEGRKSSLWCVLPRMLRPLFEQLAETGRLFHRREADGKALLRLRWSPDQPSHAAVKLEPSAGKNNYALRVVVRDEAGSELIGGADLTLDGSPGVVLKDGVLSPLYSDGYLEWGKHLSSARPIRVNDGDVGSLLGALADLGVEAPVVWPEELKVTELVVTPTPRLLISDKPGQEGHAARVLAVYDGVAVDIGQPRGAGVSSRGADGVLRLVRRDTEAEQRFDARMADVGVRRWNGEEYRRFLPPKKLQPTVVALLAEGWEVAGEKGKFRTGGAVTIAVSSGIDWFDLEGKVSFGEVSADISAVLEALHSGVAWVELGDGTRGMLPDEWLAKHGSWLALGEGGGKGVRFKRSQLSVIDAMLASMPEAGCDEALAMARKRLRSFSGITARAEAPAGFKGQLRPYQAEGVAWLGFLRELGLNGCLADDMGLGKTIEVLAHLMECCEGGGAAGAGPTLVVAPKSLVSNWAGEAAKFAPGLAVRVYAGIGRRKDTQALAGDGLVLTSYGTMREDIELLSSVRWGCVILDEAQAIKNSGSQTAKAARLLQGDRRLAMTGTPVENRLEDLWSIYEFLNPGMLGRSKRFEALLKSSRQGGEMAAEDVEMVRRVIRPLLLRRTKGEVAKDLPSRTEQTVTCKLGVRQRKLYDGLKMHYRQSLLGEVSRKGMAKSKMNILEALLRLRQAACHPGLIDPAAGLVGKRRSAASDGGSAKFDTLLPMVDEVVREGHKVLLFSQFTSLLDLLEPELKMLNTGIVRIDGKTAAKDRKAAVDRFQADAETKVFLISLKAGGVGLNLTAADYVFLLDPWWNPAVEAQAIDRAHRIGQTRPVVAYRLLAENTVEEKIAALQGKKKQLADALVSGDTGPLSSLTREDLEFLLE